LLQQDLSGLRYAIAVCFSIFLISSMALVSPAQAEGSVSAATAYWGGGNNSGYNCAGLSSLEAVQSCEVAKRQKWLADDLAYFASWGTHPNSCPDVTLSDAGPSGVYVDVFSLAYYRVSYSCGFWCAAYCSGPTVDRFDITTQLSCSANTTTTSPPCICKDGYVPDSAGTSCVPVSTCPGVPALTPLPKDDACANVLENIHSTQAQKDAACGALTDKLKTGMACFRDKLSRTNDIVTGNPIPFVVTSDIRDIAYQAHLREVWDKMQLLVKLMKDDPAMQTACAARRAEIAAEKGCDNAGVCKSCYSESATQRSHCLKGMPADPNPNDAQHTQGNAFDVSATYTIAPLRVALGALRPPQNIPLFLDAPTNCGLIWGGMFITNKDPVHFLAR
jgi:hypothetical protein